MIRYTLHRMFYLLLSFFHSSDNFWRTLDDVGIIVFQGHNGSGKSLAMVNSALRVLDGVQWSCYELSHGHHEAYRDHVASGDCTAACDLRTTENRGVRCEDGERLVQLNSKGIRRIYSTVTLLGDDGNEHPLYAPLYDYNQLISLEHCDIFFDEVAGVSDASDSTSIPVQVTNFMHKLRKADCRLRVTTPDFERCSKPIRQACQVVVDAESACKEPGESGRIWRPRRVMKYRAYDKHLLTSVTPDVRKTLKPMAKAVFWRPGCEAESRYDTLGQVSTLAHVDQFGICMSCDGVRRRPACKCADEPAPRGKRARGVPLPDPVLAVQS